MPGRLRRTYFREQMGIAEQTAESWHAVLGNVMDALVNDGYRDEMREFIAPDTLDMRLGASDTVTMEYQGIHGWAKARIIVLERKNGRITGILWLIEDIGEEKRKQNELRYLSETDLMTGIRNRGSGERMVKEALENMLEGMFCVIDVDHFKTINDSCGHDTGDKVIRAMADCMKETFRKGDIILRLGGDEFAAYAAGCTDEAEADRLLRRFLDAVGRIDIPALRGRRAIEVSIGAGFFTAGSGKSFETLYKEADTAAYRSKKAEGSCVTYSGRD